MTRQSQSIRPRKGVNIVNYDDYITPEIEKRQKDLNWGEAPPPPPPGQRWRRWARRWRGAVVAAAVVAARRWARSAGTGARRSSCRSSIRATLYLGANHLFKTSRSRRHVADLISPDLTKNITERILRKSGGLTPDEDPGGGAEFYGTIVTIAESPLDAG